MPPVRRSLPPLQPRFDVERPEDWEPTAEEDPGFWELERWLNTAKRGVNTAADFMFGETQEDQAQQAISDLMGVGVMPLGSRLRSAAYRSKMLKRLMSQITELDPSTAQNMFRRLTVTHPRVMAAFQHAKGTLQRDPEYTPAFVQEATAKGTLPHHLGQFHGGPPSEGLVPGLRNVRRRPGIDITPPEWLAGSNWDPPPEVLMSGTAAHEATHWAQLLGGRQAKKRYEIMDELAEDIGNTVVEPQAYMKRRGTLRQADREIVRELERGADFAEGNQLQRTWVEDLADRNTPEPSFIQRLLSLLPRR